MDALKAVDQVAHAGPACNVAWQAFHLDIVGIAGGIHLIIEAQVWGRLIFERGSIVAISPPHGDGLADKAVAALVQHIDIDVVFAARLLLVFPACFDQAPVLLAWAGGCIVNGNPQLRQARVQVA